MSLAHFCKLQLQVKNMGSSFRQPLYRIELPGYPILSDGKADNQNHALPFSRGTITQCVDSNQGAVEALLVSHTRLNQYTLPGAGAYFEQMMLLPCALAEFRWNAKQTHGLKLLRGRSKKQVALPVLVPACPERIVGFPEHITSSLAPT